MSRHNVTIVYTIDFHRQQPHSARPAVTNDGYFDTRWAGLVFRTGWFECLPGFGAIGWRTQSAG